MKKMAIVTMMIWTFNAQAYLMAQKLGNQVCIGEHESRVAALHCSSDFKTRTNIDKFVDIFNRLPYDKRIKPAGSNFEAVLIEKNLEWCGQIIPKQGDILWCAPNSAAEPRTQPRETPGLARPTPERVETSPYTEAGR